MSLKRYAKSVDGTIPVPALLYEDEDLLASQEGVGIYDGTQKSAPHQSGTIYTTTHRIFYIDGPHPYRRSFWLDLAHVAKTEYYAGLFTSSPKVTLYLNSLPTANGDGSAADDPVMTAGTSFVAIDPAFDSWECEVCSYRNPPGLSPAASRVCALCGVPRASVKPSNGSPAKSALSSISPYVSSSLPSSSLNLSKLTMSSASSPLPSSSPPTHGDSKQEEVACPACTFFNHPSLSTCEICGTPLPTRSSSVLAPHFPAKSAPASRSTTPMVDPTDENDTDSPESRIIRVSFRKGGDKAFYSILRRSLLGKGWETKGFGNISASSRFAESGTSTTTGTSGINGILRTVETTAATAQTDLEDALQDLEALMVKWKDMVRLAQDLNERLTAASFTASNITAVTSTSPVASSSASAALSPSNVTAVSSLGPPMTTEAVEPEEATFIRSSLAQLGLQMANAPVTLDMIHDERKWVEELARELAGILQGRDRDEGMMRKRGIVGLDEVWGGWNRARGVALIPPDTFLQVLPQLPQHTSPPIHMRTFPSSGLSVLHTPPYTKAAFASRLVGLLTLAGPKTTVEVAQEEGLPIGLVDEMVTEVEHEGEICRDEGGAGISFSAVGDQGWGGEVTWWVNIFQGYEWDGQAS
ncbi:EAP30/Vps36 family-domain-containing protein [Sparassis latifolia]|uniref:Vacuolar protein-sorting-associated protein 36 n=1 Tax=Sparassis crispa TaxID=139825 RepID=A0A401GY01_9APHY|nr:predicted protein [Sparassis crispa]GBE87072.1 predicted protein [Sparassis crispa]